MQPGVGANLEETIGGEALAHLQQFSTEVVQTPARVNVTCVTPLGEEAASTW
jgi:hypothetical protein